MTDTNLAAIEPTPMTLLQQALSQNVDPEKLGKLMDLQERWSANQAKQAYCEAMSECQRSMPAVVRDRENTHTRSRYATLEAVNTAIKPVYTDHGFSISFTEDESTPELVKISATVQHRGGHSEQFHTAVPIDGVGVKGVANKTATQGKGSTLTYARRYLTLMIFNIAIVDEDTDGNPENQTLSEEQVFFLQDLMDKCESAGVPVDKKRFFALVKLSDDAELADIEQRFYESVKTQLSNKLAKAMEAVAS